MNKKVVLLTGTELRHDFFRKYLAHHKDITVLASFCESNKGNLSQIVRKDNQQNDLRSLHLSAREATEKEFFGDFCDNTVDQSGPIFIEKGDINNQEQRDLIIKLNPDIIISYGCSVIRSEIVSVFQGRFINIHLGLSPYYRGSGTNFWPFVNNELQFIGATFMHIDKGIDTGEIIHQIRAKVSPNDSIHLIGNRLIQDSFIDCVKLIRSFDKIEPMMQISISSENERYFRNIDFTQASLKKAYNNISNGIVEDYLINKTKLEKEFPIIINPAIGI